MCLNTEEAATGLGLQASLESGKGKGRDSPLELLEEHSPANTWDLSPVRPLQTSDLQDCKLVDLCCTYLLEQQQETSANT